MIIPSSYFSLVRHSLSLRHLFSRLFRFSRFFAPSHLFNKSSSCFFFLFFFSYKCLFLFLNFLPLLRNSPAVSSPFPLFSSYLPPVFFVFLSVFLNCCRNHYLSRSLDFPCSITSFSITLIFFVMVLTMLCCIIFISI